MSNEEVINIDTEKVEGLEKYSGQYVAISLENKVVGSGSTYTEAVESAGDRRDYALFAVPNLKFGLSPLVS